VRILLGINFASKKRDFPQKSCRILNKTALVLIKSEQNIAQNRVILIISLRILNKTAQDIDKSALRIGKNRENIGKRPPNIRKTALNIV
jgi:hypothetical protein